MNQPVTTFLSSYGCVTEKQEELSGYALGADEKQRGQHTSRRENQAA
jgi:hypothetical protein